MSNLYFKIGISYTRIIFDFPALLPTSETTTEIISAINRMVEQDFARQERAKFQEARTRYIQIRLSEVATTDDSESKGATSGVATEGEESSVVEKEPPTIGDSLKEDDLQDSVFYSTSPCHLFRETTV